MTHYANRPGSVRVSYFKPSGKWYMDEALDMSDFYQSGITPIDAVRAAILADSDPGRGARLLSQFTAVVLEPYHELAYPVMLVPRAAA